MQMVMGAWVSRTIAALSRAGVPDLLKKYGALTAAQMVEKGIDAHADTLQRVLRAAASLGIFSESADGHFGPTALSEVLTSDAAGSVKGIVELFNSEVWQLWGALPEAMRTGEPQSKNVLGMETWEFLNANPKKLEAFGEAMKSNSHASLVGVLEHCDFSAAKKWSTSPADSGTWPSRCSTSIPHCTACCWIVPS
jgi:hypothetical protein